MYQMKRESDCSESLPAERKKFQSEFLITSNQFIGVYSLGTFDKEK